MIIRIVVACVLFLLGIFSNSCSSAGQSKIREGRIVHCRVVADKSFYEDGGSWRENINTLMKRLSYDFENWFNISVVVDTVMTFDMNNYDCVDATGMSCLYENLPRTNEDFTIHFFRGGGYALFETIGITRPDIGYVAVKQMENVNVDMRFQYLYTTLLHEMCHLFGAVHVYYTKGSNNLMLPFTKDNVVKVGKDLAMLEAEIDKGNTAIIKGMSKRAFGLKSWSDTLWPKIERLYNRQLSQLNYSKINEQGILVDFYDDHFIPPEFYDMLSDWAALCGNDSAAFYYLEKQIDYIRNFAVACNIGELGGRSKLMCYGYYGINTAEHIRLIRVYHRYNRAIALLKAGKQDEANNEINLLMSEGRDYPDVKWRLFEQQYKWERDHLWSEK